MAVAKKKKPAAKKVTKKKIVDMAIKYIEFGLKNANFNAVSANTIILKSRLWFIP